MLSWGGSVGECVFLGSSHTALHVLPLGIAALITVQLDRVLTRVSRAGWSC